MKQRRRAAKRSQSAVHRRRVIVLAGLGLLGYAALVARAVQLQALDAEWLSQRAAAQHRGTLRLEPLRGELRDRANILLAVSAEVESVAISPRRIQDRRGVARRLARALDLRPGEVERRLRPDRSFAWIRRWVSAEQADHVRALALAGVSLHPERKRFYPNRELAASYLGFAGRDGEGLSGLELLFDAALRGRGARLPALRDARGQILLDVAARAESRTGANVVLALDAKLQHFAEGALERALHRTGAKRGSIVALDPVAGDLLALAEAPGFDPNRFWAVSPERYRTRALLDPFEPGSTLKPFTIAVALEQGVVKPSDRFDCENGVWRLRDRTIRDWKGYGALSVHDIVRLSSNIGAAKVAELVGSARLVAGLRALGFGERTGSGFPGEAAGVVRDLGEAQVVERANLAFGQGITVTALQLATAGALLANGGYRVRPRVALRLELGGESVPLESGRGERVLSRATTQAVLRMMRDVVASGTGRRAALPRHSVAGKTGTAQKIVEGRYSEEHYIASFLGIVPSENPRLVMVVILDDPQGARTGGAVAAPLFREVAGFAVEQLALPPGGAA